MTYTIIIDNWVIPSVNKLKGHWGNTKRIKTGVTQMIAAYSRHVPKATNKRKVQIIHQQPRGRLPDPDNLFKCCFDSLKNLGLIIDDRASKLDFDKPITRYGKKQTIITISEAE